MASSAISFSEDEVLPPRDGWEMQSNQGQKSQGPYRVRRHSRAAGNSQGWVEQPPKNTWLPGWNWRQTQNPEDNLGGNLSYSDQAENPPGPHPLPGSPTPSPCPPLPVSQSCSSSQSVVCTGTQAFLAEPVLGSITMPTATPADDFFLHESVSDSVLQSHVSAQGTDLHNCSTWAVSDLGITSQTGAHMCNQANGQWFESHSDLAVQDLCDWEPLPRRERGLRRGTSTSASDICSLIEQEGFDQGNLCDSFQAVSDDTYLADLSDPDVQMPFTQDQDLCSQETGEGLIFNNSASGFHPDVLSYNMWSDPYLYNSAQLADIGLHNNVSEFDPDLYGQAMHATLDFHYPTVIGTDLYDNITQAGLDFYNQASQQGLVLQSGALGSDIHSQAIQECPDQGFLLDPTRVDPGLLNQATQEDHVFLNNVSGFQPNVPYHDTWSGPDLQQWAVLPGYVLQSSASEFQHDVYYGTAWSSWYLPCQVTVPDDVFWSIAIGPQPDFQSHLISDGQNIYSLAEMPGFCPQGTASGFGPEFDGSVKQEGPDYGNYCHPNYLCHSTHRGSDLSCTTMAGPYALNKTTQVDHIGAELPGYVLKSNAPGSHRNSYPGRGRNRHCYSHGWSNTSQTGLDLLNEADLQGLALNSGVSGSPCDGHCSHSNGAGPDLDNQADLQGHTCKSSASGSHCDCFCGHTTETGPDLHNQLNLPGQALRGNESGSQHNYQCGLTMRAGSDLHNQVDVSACALVDNTSGSQGDGLGRSRRRRRRHRRRRRRTTQAGMNLSNGAELPECVLRSSASGSHNDSQHHSHTTQASADLHNRANLPSHVLRGSASGSHHAAVRCRRRRRRRRRRRHNQPELPDSGSPGGHRASRHRRRTKRVVRRLLRPH
ncbi:uncharacterized protein RHO17_003649 [Thomomys bottae]